MEFGFSFFRSRLPSAGSVPKPRIPNPNSSDGIGAGTRIIDGFAVGSPLPESLAGDRSPESLGGRNDRAARWNRAPPSAVRREQFNPTCTIEMVAFSHTTSHRTESRYIKIGFDYATLSFRSKYHRNQRGRDTESETRRVPVATQCVLSRNIPSTL